MKTDSTERSDEILDFDKEWDYNDPATTEKKFRQFLEDTGGKSTSYVLQLKTQIARTLGLQRKFDDAHSLLDEIEEEVENYPLAKVRYFLERGRAYRSGGDKEKSHLPFLEAFELSSKHGFDNFTVDAAHMMGIIETPDKQMEWNERAISIAENSQSERARDWLGSLLNNLGWTYHDLKNYDRALELFQDALVFREEKGIQEPILIAKWCIARVYRSLGRIDESLQIQLELLKTNKQIHRENGYTQEELGELYLVTNHIDESKRYFKQAYEILSNDPWLMEHEKSRLDRINSLSKDS